MSTLKQPETIRQAQTHQQYTTAYQRHGLCIRCAAQAAYGHQHGFNQVHRPCESCAPIVATFPEAKANGWRALGGHPAGPKAELGNGGGEGQYRDQMPDGPAAEAIPSLMVERCDG